MQEIQHRYLIHIQYLGFRYHGWQKQPRVKTVESMIEKTLEFVLGQNTFKILGTSRTDSMVSANHSAFMLFVQKGLDLKGFQTDLNENLPPDIRVTQIEIKDSKFNILNSHKIKEYLYLFSYGTKAHPFCAPLMASFPGDLDIDIMQKGAKRFEGSHHFIQYCTKPGEDTCLQRDILECQIKENKAYQASFFPDQSWLLQVRAKGFLRYQIRLIMGQLLELGRHRITIDDIEYSLTGDDKKPLRNIAPASGLILNKIWFEPGAH